MSADKHPEHHKRDLLLSDRISQSTVKDIIKDIFEINFDDDEKEEIYKDWERKPIQLFINSYGGSVYDGLALIDVIKRSKTPVHTVCIGSCMSMALWVWLSGAKRFVGESATLMQSKRDYILRDKQQRSICYGSSNQSPFQEESCLYHIRERERHTLLSKFVLLREAQKCPYILKSRDFCAIIICRQRKLLAFKTMKPFRRSLQFSLH